MACLTYFFFSIEHKGVVGRTAKVGIWVLMITFGAGFAYTVMGRITLLTQRIEFLFGDWLRLINGPAVPRLTVRWVRNMHEARLPPTALTFAPASLRY